MKEFTITVENDKRKQVFTQKYASDGYARLSLYHAMSDMLDSAIKETFAGKPKEYDESAQKFNYSGNSIPISENGVFADKTLDSVKKHDSVPHVEGN